MTTDKSLPTWLLTLTSVLIIFNFFVFGWLTLLQPELTWPDAGAGGVFPAQFFAVRHIAIAVPLLHGLLKRDGKILLAMYMMFFIIAILDVALIFTNGYYIPLVVQVIGHPSQLVGGLLATAMFILPMGYTALWLRKRFA